MVTPLYRRWRNKRATWRHPREAVHLRRGPGLGHRRALLPADANDGRMVTGRVGNIFGDPPSVIEDMFDPGHTTNVRRTDIETRWTSRGISLK